MDKLCECGCGQIVPPAKRTRSHRGIVKGQPMRFINGHNANVLTSEEQSRRGRCNNGSTLRGTGEGKSYTKFHQRHLHRIIAEEKLGRPLQKGEIVHHKDCNRKNNNPDNIEVLPSQGDHCRSHSFGGRKNKQPGGSNE